MQTDYYSNNPITGVQQIRCNRCATLTRHEILGSFTVNGSVDSHEWWITHYYTCKCLGCDDVTFVEHLLFSENVNFGYQNGKQESYIDATERMFPPRLYREIPGWFSELDGELASVLKEVYIALQNNAPRLATIGTRTALEIVMVEKTGDGGTFANTVRRFKDAGHIAASHADFLLEILDTGNAAAHRGYGPDAGTLSEIFDIVEQLIRLTQVVPKQLQKVSATVPKREKR